AVDGALRAANVVGLWEAATVHGGGPWHTLRRVIIPSTRNGLAAGSLLVFASAMGELALARLITGSAFETLPLWQLRQLRGTDAKDIRRINCSDLRLIAGGWCSSIRGGMRRLGWRGFSF